MAGENENPENVSNSSSEEEVEMENDEADDSSGDEASEIIIQEAQQKVCDDPFVYEHRANLIAVLRKAGELEKLRAARTEMQKIFPLTPELWLEWIEDETKVMSSPEERDKVEELYNQAVGDYPSPKVWLEFVQFAISDMTRKGIQYPRAIFDRALTSVGLHVTQGSVIWIAYREYETAVLAGLQPLGSIPTPTQKEDIDSQTKRIINLLKRQLAVPHQDIEATYEEYQEFCEEVDPVVTKTYEKSKEKLKKFMPFEDSLENARPPRTDAYKSYIKHELKEGEPTRIQCIFERALIENYHQPDFWIKYGKYLDFELRSRSAILKMYSRAVKNCPWSVDLWLLHMRALERFQYQSHDLIKDTFEKQLVASYFSSASDFLKVWTAYSDYMRRRIDWEKEDQEKKIEELRSTFERAVEFLMANFGKDGDPNCTLLQYRARIEAKFCKNMKNARECWNQTMQQGFGNQYQMWLEYFNIERAFGDHKHCRKILQRALNSVTDWPEYMVEAYLNFEREEGTLEQYEQALEKCEAQMSRIEERRAKEHETEALKKKQIEDISKWSKMSVQKKRKRVCELCQGKGHESLTYKCDALQEPPLYNVTAFKGKLDVLSNFYPCKLRFEGKEYASTEHLYQYYKAIRNGREDLAKKILLLEETRDVKLLSKEIKTNEDWFEKKGPLFDRILAAKLLYCPEYARALLDAKEVMAEAVPGDTYWSTGLSKDELVYTKMKYWPGENVMGKMHMKLRGIIRSKLSEEDGEARTTTGVARLTDICQKVAEKEARLQGGDDVADKMSRGYQKQREDREVQQKKHQLRRDQGKRQKVQPQTVTKSSPSKTDQDVFKLPRPPGMTASTDQTSPVKARQRGPPPGYERNVESSDQSDQIPTGQSRERRPPPPGYKRNIDSDERDENQPQLKKQKVIEDSAPEECGQGEDDVEKCKVFVSNLRYDTKECDLTPIFIQYGDLKDIRLVKQTGGKTRGFGYVEYRQETSAKAALALDRHEIDGRPMFVSECKPRKEERGTFKFSTEMEKCKLFVRNLPLSTTKEALSEIFSKYGTVKDTRLVTHKSGAPKGLAFVEYFEEEAASKAVMQADGLKIGHQEISVAISNPPGRKAPASQREQPSTFQPSLGGGKKEADRGGRAKTMLAFQPRSVQNKAKVAIGTAGTNTKPSGMPSNEGSQGEGDGPSEGKKSGLSNADFRSMLLKK